MSLEVEHWSSPDGCHPDCPACDQEAAEAISQIEPQLTVKLHVTRCLHVEVPKTINSLDLETYLHAFTPGNDWYALKDGIPIPAENVRALLGSMEDGECEKQPDIHSLLTAAMEYASAHDADEFLFHP